jgi:hypothetical protein
MALKLGDLAKVENGNGEESELIIPAECSFA